MGCTIYAASPQGLPSDQAPGRDRYYMLPPHPRHPRGPSSQKITADSARLVVIALHHPASSRTGARMNIIMAMSS
ncbi:hypothetical protein NHX12_006271 [Muraenolepis orangiensis]|uniref:Uncharacterized protein n=1 Tax=Muraenolepis orangiensis TaxID=630683 RepID=A0A9Q0IDM6_9TELE|nr:hypothetical protein NHX12_006271 [Muraenolepis orangiensis]